MKPKALQAKRPPTILDVAQAASVGVMSVSRVINNHPSVKASTRDKVMKAISRIGYTPNDAARMLKGRTSHTIGLVVPDLSDFFASCFHVVQDVATKHEYHTLVIATGKDSTMEERQLDSIRNHHLAGLLIVSSGGNGRCLKTLQESGMPVVALDRPIPDVDTDTVLVENNEGARQGVEHLIEHGHRRIACVGFDSGSYTTRERIDGYQKAMLAAGLEPVFFTQTPSLDAMQKLVTEWKTSVDRPTAVFSIKRISTVFLVQSLHRAGFRVPEDIAVVGFDDFELAEVLGTPLTVVRQAPTEIARVAVDILFHKIQSADTVQQKPMRILFPAELVIRNSCGCNNVGK